MKKYDETYIDKAKCIKDGFIRTKKGVCKMTVLERLYHKGKLDFGSSGAGAFDRLKAGEYLASDYEKGHFNVIGSAWGGEKVDCGNSNVSSGILTEMRSRYFMAAKSVPSEFWPIVRSVCIENKLPETDSSYSERKRGEIAYLQYCDLCRGLDRLIEFYHKIKIQL